MSESDHEVLSRATLSRTRARQINPNVEDEMRLFGVLLASMFMASGSGCASEPPGTTSTSQAVMTSQYGFALVQSSGTSVVSGRSWNASGTISAQRVGNYYQLTFANLGGDGGIAKVVAVGSDNVRCKIVTLAKSGSDEIIYYLCHEPDGTETDSAAVVQYLRDDGYPYDKAAFVYANNESLPFQYCPSSNTYNSTGGDNCITRSSTGSYDVVVEGLAELAGSVEVTAVGTDAAHCNVNLWGPASMGSSDQKVVVKCYDETGSPKDSEFMLNYHGAGAIDYAGLGAYAWANNPTLSSYVPNTSYSFNAPTAFCLSSPPIAAGRVGQGNYYLDFDKKALVHSAVHVTAYGTSGYCKVADWTGTPNGSYDDVEISVHCYDSAGNAADATYVGTYNTEYIVGPC